MQLSSPCLAIIQVGLSFDFVLYKRKSEMLFFSTELSIDPARNVRGLIGIGWQLSGDVCGHRALV